MIQADSESHGRAVWWGWGGVSGQRERTGNRQAAVKEGRGRRRSPVLVQKWPWLWPWPAPPPWWPPCLWPCLLCFLRSLLPLWWWRRWRPARRAGRGKAKREETFIRVGRMTGRCQGKRNRWQSEVRPGERRAERGSERMKVNTTCSL